MSVCEVTEATEVADGKKDLERLSMYATAMIHDVSKISDSTALCIPAEDSRFAHIIPDAQRGYETVYEACKAVQKIVAQYVNPETAVDPISDKIYPLMAAERNLHERVIAFIALVGAVNPDTSRINKHTLEFQERLKNFYEETTKHTEQNCAYQR